MSRAHFEKLKQALFEQYEEQITALVEGSAVNDESHVDGCSTLADAQEEATRQLQDEITGHLRLSYPRQRLLCLRAARLRPAEPHSASPDEKEQACTRDRTVEHEGAAPVPLSPFIFVKDSTEPPPRAAMHRLQDESVQQLRSAILAQAQNKQARQQENREHDTADAGEAANKKTTLQPGVGVVVAAERDASLNIIRHGGVQGVSYVQQRLDILDKLERQLLEERVARLAHDVCVV